MLVTHHVQLVLPGTYYLVRMLDGRIDTQGTVRDLRARGVLDDIAFGESIEAHREKQVADTEEAAASVGADNVENIVTTKKPRKLVEEEKRETGRVKWRIYNTYLKASCVVIYSLSMG